MVKKTIIRVKRRKKTVDAKQTKAIRTLKKKVRALEAPIEMKYAYEELNTGVITGGGAVTKTINLIRPWDSSSTTANNSRLNFREGDKVTMKRFTMRGKLKLPYNTQSVTRQATTRVRFIYVYYEDYNGGVCNIADILETSIGVDLVDYFYKRNGRLRYKILKDVTMNLQPDYYNYADVPNNNVKFSGLQSTKPSFHTIRHSLDLSKLPRQGEACWNDATALPRMGQICLYMMSDNQSTDVDLTSLTQLTWMDQ